MRLYKASSMLSYANMTDQPLDKEELTVDYAFVESVL
jgi:hypothetical protein